MPPWLFLWFVLQKNLCSLVFDEAICKKVNVMDILYFYETFFHFTKKFFWSWLWIVFFEIYLPPPAVWCFQLIFIIQYAVRKDIFACLFSVHWTSTLNWATFWEILPPSFTKKACKFVMKRDSKNFLEVAKGIERLLQNSLAKLRFSDYDSG